MLTDDFNLDVDNLLDIAELGKRLVVVAMSCYVFGDYTEEELRVHLRDIVNAVNNSDDADDLVDEDIMENLRTLRAEYEAEVAATPQA